ncbi:MAG TPA: acetate kinase [Candidatus Acidoferrum sp.]
MAVLTSMTKILVLNSGSSSQKSSLYEIGHDSQQSPATALWEGKIEWNQGDADVHVTTSQGANLQQRVKIQSRVDAIEHLLNTLWTGHAKSVSGPSEIDFVGHRVVHGGQRFKEPTLITAEVRSAIASMSAFAPLHNRAELEGIDIVEKKFGVIPQIAVFDTSFHSQLPDAAAVYPGPYEWVSRGIRRYGFHGINHQYCAERAAQLLGRDLCLLKLITCHLGNGCSLAAIEGGRSIDTTMGFTPLDGLMMGTRSGAVDPGILTYLMRQDSLSGQQLDDLLNTGSGLLGISGTSSDMRQIVANMKGGDARAKLAFDVFIHRLQSCIGAMIGVLGGLDALVFTAGIGENSAEVRGAACANLGFVGLKLDDIQNTHSSADRDISAPDSGVRVLIIRAEEDWAIARTCWRLTSEKTHGRASAD